MQWRIVDAVDEAVHCQRLATVPRRAQALQSAQMD